MLKVANGHKISENVEKGHKRCQITTFYAEMCPNKAAGHWNMKKLCQEKAKFFR